MSGGGATNRASPRRCLLPCGLPSCVAVAYVNQETVRAGPRTRTYSLTQSALSRTLTVPIKASECPAKYLVPLSAVAVNHLSVPQRLKQVE